MTTRHKRVGQGRDARVTWCGAKITASTMAFQHWKPVDCSECLASKQVGFPGLKRNNEGELVNTVPLP